MNTAYIKLLPLCGGGGLFVLTPFRLRRLSVGPWVGRRSCRKLKGPKYDPYSCGSPIKYDLWSKDDVEQDDLSESKEDEDELESC